VKTHILVPHLTCNEMVMLFRCYRGLAHEAIKPEYQEQECVSLLISLKLIHGTYRQIPGKHSSTLWYTCTKRGEERVDHCCGVGPLPKRACDKLAGAGRL
jgi:hypothetical protein